jgi:signal transduction histidine kinase
MSPRSRVIRRPVPDGIPDAPAPAGVATSGQLAAHAHEARLSLAANMIAGIAHELTQPLSVIMCSATACQDALGPAAPGIQHVSRDLDRIVNSAHYAGQIVNRLRQFIAPHQSQVARLNINDVIRGAVDFFAYEFRLRRIDVVLRLHPDLPTIQADAVQLQQVLVNLLQNALHAVTQPEIRVRRITLESSPAGREAVEVVVADSGAGVSPDAAPRIFEPYFSTKGSGLGIGLPICDALIRAHGGAIWLRSTIGSGAAFHIRIPCQHTTEDRPGERRVTGPLPC